MQGKHELILNELCKKRVENLNLNIGQQNNLDKIGSTPYTRLRRGEWRMENGEWRVENGE